MTPDSFIPSKGKTCVEVPFEVDVEVEVDESKVNEVKSMESLTSFVLFILMITNIQALDVPKTNQTHSIWYTSIDKDQLSRNSLSLSLSLSTTGRSKERGLPVLDGWIDGWTCAFIHEKLKV